MSVSKKNFWFKQIVVWIVTLIISISVMGEAQAKDLTQYEQMSGEEKFIEIKEQVVHSRLLIYQNIRHLTHIKKLIKH